MSIYVLRSANLIKIGYSNNLRTRVGGIISGSPVPVEFVGHMPGSREVEAHLHARFADARFSGEWFVESPAMRDLFALLLIPGLPKPETVRESKRRVESDYQGDIAKRLRDAAQARWPHKGVMERLDALRSDLGWPKSRVKDVYYSHTSIRLRAIELEEIEAWLAVEVV